MTFKSCISIVLCALVLCCILPVQAQTSPPATAPPFVLSDTPTTVAPAWILGSGLGFKPYQTSVKDGSSGFLQGCTNNQFGGSYTCGRVVFHPTYAEFVAEECKNLYSRDKWMILGCGDVGVGATSDNAGSIFGGGGKLFYRIGKPDRDGNLTMVGLEIGGTRSNVPAPISAAGAINKVQPDLRVGIHKTFN